MAPSIPSTLEIVFILAVMFFGGIAMYLYGVSMAEHEHDAGLSAPLPVSGYLKILGIFGVNFAIACAVVLLMDKKPELQKQ